MSRVELKLRTLPEPLSLDLVFSAICAARSIVSFVMFCRALFALLSIAMYCMSFFNLRILITL